MPSTPIREQSSTHDTVLFVDDNSEDIDNWSNHLKNSSSHYAIVSVSSVEAALVLVRHQRVDCVVLDLDLPQSSGFVLLLALVPDRHRPRIPIVVLTRLRNPALHRMTVENGAHACLVKSETSAQDLDNAIQQAIVSISAKRNDGPPVYQIEPRQPDDLESHG